MLPGEHVDGQTPLDDISGLRVRGIATRAELDAAEAMNIRKAIVKYIAGTPTARSAPFTVRWMLRVHKEMFGDVWKWAGEPRSAELNMGSPAHRLHVDLHELVADLAAWAQSAMPLVEQAARLHHRAVSIHPFLNGNGRWGRMLANIWLKRNGSAPTAWPEETIATASIIRGEYLAAVRAADRGDYALLIRLHEQHALK